MRFWWERSSSIVHKCIFCVNVYAYNFRRQYSFTGWLDKGCPPATPPNRSRIALHMARTNQRKKSDSDLSTGSCGRRKISTIRPKECKKDELTYQEKLTILRKMEEMGWTQRQTASYFNNKGYGNWVSQRNMSCWLKD